MRDYREIRDSYREYYFLHIVFFTLLNIIYWQIAGTYSYMYTKFTCVFQPLKFSLAVSLFLIVTFLLKYIKNDFIFFVYNVSMILIFDGECVCYSFNKDSGMLGMVSGCVFLLCLLLCKNLRFKLRPVKAWSKNYYVLFSLAIIMFIPFVAFYYNKIDLSNLLLQNIYDTRILYRDISNPIIGYLTAPLARVLLPFLIITNIKKKRWIHVAIFGAMVLFIFLCGALKSIAFGLFAVFVFYAFDNRKKIMYFMRALNIASLLGIIVYAVFGNMFIVNLMRRIFFVPSRLINFYAEFFAGNHTYLSHSALSFGLVNNQFTGVDLSRYFGESVMGYPGLNANVGVLTEGYVSFGYFGVVLVAIIFSLIFQFFKSLDVDPMYMGIFFTYIYYMNTAFLSTFLLTHGLLFFMIFAYLFMRSRIE